MQHGGQSRFKGDSAGRKGGKRHLCSGRRMSGISIGGRSRPRLDYPLAKRAECLCFGPRNTSILALNHPGLVRLCGLDPANDAQDLAKAL
jgi:hypothetical protein